MSTRATYQFSNTSLAGEDVTVYIHYDGYPLGAAGYFLAAMNEKMDSGKPLLEAFITANDGALITRDHEAHGDTDYRYWTDGTMIKVEKREIKFTDDGYHNEWTVIHDRTLNEFIVIGISSPVAAEIYRQLSGEIHE